MEKITNNQTGAIGEEAVIQFLSARNAEIVTSLADAVEFVGVHSG